MRWLRRWLRNTAGQDLIEYVLLGSFVSIVAMVGAQELGTRLNTWYDTLAQWVDSATQTIPAGTEPSEPAQ